MSAVATRHPRLNELVARRMLRGKIERAVDRLLTILDDLDGDPDLEPTNGGGQVADRNPVTADAEAEDEHGGDVLDEGEKTLGWPANVSQVALGTNTADGDITAPERHGMGFVRCGFDDMEADQR